MIGTSIPTVLFGTLILAVPFGMLRLRTCRQKKTECRKTLSVFAVFDPLVLRPFTTPPQFCKRELQYEHKAGEVPATTFTHNRTNLMTKVFTRSEIVAVEVITSELGLDHIETIKIVDHPTYEQDPSIFRTFYNGDYWTEKPYTLILYTNYVGDEVDMAYVYFDEMEDKKSFDTYSGTYSSRSEQVHYDGIKHWYLAGYEKCWHAMMAPTLEREKQLD